MVVELSKLLELNTIKFFVYLKNYLSHGALLCILRLYTIYVADRYPILKSKAIGVFSWALTMASVMFGWMLFVLPTSQVFVAIKIMAGGKIG